MDPRWGDTETWRLDPILGGQSRAFGDIGIHWCDLVEFVSGHRIVRLTAQLLAPVDRPSNGTGATEDAAMILFQTDHGAAGTMVASQITPGRKNRLWFSVDGADSSLAFDQELPDSLWVGEFETTRTVARAAVPGGPGVDPFHR